MVVIAASGCTSTPSSNDSNSQVNNTPTPAPAPAPAAEQVLLEKGNVKMANGNIYVDNQLVGTYKIVTKPPAKSADVDYRTWQGTRVEVVDFSGTGNYLDYYTQYNGKWVKMSIDTTQSKTALEITNDIYTAMG